LKVIFLDYDGVIQTVRSKFKPDPECINNLNLITNTTQARIVVSSMWRKDGLRNNRERLKQWGVHGTVVACTPDLTITSPKGVSVSVDRGTEIGEWLARGNTKVGLQPYPIESLIILDDDTDMGNLRYRLIRTNPHVGLTGEDVQMALMMLNQKQMPMSVVLS